MWCWSKWLVNQPPPRLTYPPPGYSLACLKDPGRTWKICRKWFWIHHSTIYRRGGVDLPPLERIMIHHELGKYFPCFFCKFQPLKTMKVKETWRKIITSKETPFLWGGDIFSLHMSRTYKDINKYECEENTTCQTTPFFSPKEKPKKQHNPPTFGVGATPWKSRTRP